MKKFSLREIKEFQERAAIVLKRGKMQYSCGLCYEIKWARESSHECLFAKGLFTAYEIMSALYNAGDEFYGPYGEMTDTRIMVLIFITTVSAKELREMANA